MRSKFPRGGWSRAWFAAAATLAVVAVLAFAPSPDFSTMRAPNPHETFYQYVAFELDAPALCGKLSPSALIPGGIFIAPSYARSDCYVVLARRYDRPSLCFSARRLGGFAILSEQTSPFSCFWNVMRRAPTLASRPICQTARTSLQFSPRWVTGPRNSTAKESRRRC